MYRILAVLFAATWVVGMVASVTMGGWIHVLPVAACLLTFIGVSKTRAEKRSREAKARGAAYEVSGPRTYHVGKVR